MPQDDWIQEIVNKYYSPESKYFELIGISKAKQVLNDDGSVKNLQHVKTMIGRLLDFFGLKCKQAKRVRGDKHFALAPSAVLENFPDIDECLEARVKAVIELAEAISLKEAADKAEERQRQQREVQEKGEEIAKQGKANSYSLRHADEFPFSSYKANENSSLNTVQEKHVKSTEERWKQPETIAEVAEMLDFARMRKP